MAKSPRVNLILSDSLVRRLREISETTGRSTSAIVRLALAGYLDRCEQLIKDNESAVRLEPKDVTYGKL